jgi:hypothetical protein
VSDTLFCVQLLIALVVVALFVLGSMIHRVDRLPWQGDFVTFSGDNRQSIKVTYRIWATWRLERLNFKKRVLTQHFEVLQGGASRRKTDRML